MIQAALLVFFNIIDERLSTRPRNSSKKTSLESCEAVRRLPRNKLVVAGNIISRSRDINELAHGTRVPGIRVLSVTWGLLSSVVLTRYLRSFIRVEGFAFKENFDDGVLCAGGVKARLSGISGVEFVFYFTEEINRVQCPAFLQQLTFGSHFNQGLRRAARPSAPQFFNVVGDDFDHPSALLAESRVLHGARVQFVLPCVL